ncbi:MAG: AI-2E family transporter [Deltaproteobacteria bacterium]|nr:AI-2E family transporter [Deltaproteobacteria bacterium]
MKETKYSELFFKIVIICGSLFAVFYLIYLLKIVTLPLFLAFFIAYFLRPVVDYLEKRNVPRVVTTISLLLTGLVLISLLIFLILPEIVVQIVQYIQRIPLIINLIMDWLQAKTGFAFSETVRSENLPDRIISHLQEIVQPAQWLLTRVFASVVSLLAFIMNILIVSVFSVFIMINYNKIIGGLKDLIPPAYKDDVLRIAGDIDNSISGFIRGQLIVCVFLAALYSVSLTIAGIPFSVAIGAGAGFLSFIPYVGIFIGLLSSIFVVLLDFTGYGDILAVVGIFTVIPIIDALLITPNIVGSKTGLNPVTVIIAILAGGTLMGFLGLLIAIPTAAAVNIIAKEAIRRYRENIGVRS